MSVNNMPTLEASLQELIQERNRLQQLMVHLDENIRAKLHQSALDSYRPVSSETVQFSIETHKGDLSISELVAFAGVSMQTYYNSIQRVDAVSVGKLNHLIGAVGLQLYIGKRQGNK
ncbi:hypothetical protein [Rheinheimera sp. UJ63]|uniref:hypothetical protein n=1 Tax=Rheinheimera sp. UJ63 TaxID=2910157 RepID=UPI001F39FB9A|nr:hypothetical protein [Rheinheimera sp. UJ63]MCF4010611.1 hypothetical protein [Rheinheimera sp. UJ63]